MYVCIFNTRVAIQCIICVIIVCTYVYIYIYIYVCIYVGIHIYVYIYIYYYILLYIYVKEGGRNVCKLLRNLASPSLLPLSLFSSCAAMARWRCGHATNVCAHATNPLALLAVGRATQAQCHAGPSGGSRRSCLSRPCPRAPVSATSALLGALPRPRLHYRLLTLCPAPTDPAAQSWPQGQ